MVPDSKMNNSNAVGLLQTDQNMLYYMHGWKLSKWSLLFLLLMDIQWTTKVNLNIVSIIWVGCQTCQYTPTNLHALPPLYIQVGPWYLSSFILQVHLSYLMYLFFHCITIYCIQVQMCIVYYVQYTCWKIILIPST